MPKNSTRDNSLDFLRGLAVIFMIITHVIALFYVGDNRIIDWFEWWGATICFTTFLFVFSVLYGLKLSKQNVSAPKEIRRFGIILLGYYLIAFWVALFYNDYRFTQILLFVKQPEFTEFIITFGWYVLVIIIFHKQLNKLIDRPLWLVIIATLSYLSSRYLHQLEISNTALQVLKSQMVGHADWHTFGILSYSPIFLMGLWWGKLLRSLSQEQLLKTSKLLASISLVLFTSVYVLKLSPWYRWPPSVLFMLYGITFCWVGTAFYKYVSSIKWFTTSIIAVGKNALIYYFGHLLILMPLLRVIEPNSSHLVITTLIIIIFTFIAAFIHLRTSMRSY